MTKNPTRTAGNLVEALLLIERATHINCASLGEWIYGSKIRAYGMCKSSAFQLPGSRLLQDLQGRGLATRHGGDLGKLWSLTPHGRALCEMVRGCEETDDGFAAAAAALESEGLLETGEVAP